MLADGSIEETRCRIDDLGRIDLGKDGQRLVVEQALRERAGVKQPQVGGQELVRFILREQWLGE